MSIIQISLTYKSSKSIIHLFIFKKLGISYYKVDRSEEVELGNANLILIIPLTGKSLSFTTTIFCKITTVPALAISNATSLVKSISSRQLVRLRATRGISDGQQDLFGPLLLAISRIAFSISSLRSELDLTSGLELH
jgi:hypothetical protein